MANVIRPSYTVRKIVLTTANIASLTKDVNRRKVRPGVVTSIKKQLDIGKHFEAPLSINKLEDGDLQLFDGQHRLIAIEKHLDDNPNDKIEVTAHVYDNLSEDEVKAEYSIVNKGTKQSTNDVIQQYSHDIPIYRMMTNGWQKGGVRHTFACPVTVYPTPKSISFLRLVGAYMAATEANWNGGVSLSAWDFVAKAQQMNSEDVTIMNAFIIDFQQAFGAVGGNDFARGTPFTALFKLWIDNRQMNPKTMIRLWKQLIGNQQIMQVSKPGGMGATKVALQIFGTTLNGTRRKNLFRIPAMV